MRRFSNALILLGVILLGASRASAQVTITPYLWEFAYVDPTTTNAPDLVARLQTEIQRLLDAGRPGGTFGGLSPVEYTHNDQGSTPGGEQYWLFTRPGRELVTIAYAYPYLTAGQKTSARAYVQALLASSTFQPFASGQLTPAQGNRREFYPMVTRPIIAYSMPTYLPDCEQMYGLWLWGWQIGGDWSDLASYQTAIRNRYTTIASACSSFYGGMGAHIAKARLESSTIWNNSTNQTTASNNLQSAMNTGLTFSTVESAISNTTTGVFRLYYNDAVTGGTPNTRKQNGQYLGWPFLGISPEVARYISASGSNITDALTRHAAGKAKYPAWFVRQAGYDNGMACLGSNCEGSGLSPETIGMIAPLERFTIGASAATMRSYTKSGPVCIGDSYWLELLVWAIESTGTLTWVDTRSGHP